MPQTFVTLFGKAIRRVAQLRGGGSALPGLFVEKIDPHFIPRTLEQLPEGVVVISGTNGKTTTTKMVVELLESQGLKVFTNRTGSNFTRGVAAALLGDIDNKGHLDADIAVLELDEAHAVHFVRAVKPRYCLLLNVMRDQLDRFGEIDTTAKLLNVIAQATSDTVVVNREDPRLQLLGRALTDTSVVYFGLADAIKDQFPSDDDLQIDSKKTQQKLDQTQPKALATLDEFTHDQATFSIDGHAFRTTLKLEGIYNVYNAAAALALVKTIVGDSLKREQLLTALAAITPAFGRGESLTVGGQPLELVLVKNPGGFRLGLKSFPPENYATMIAVNDNYADGRDMSWLWDVSFESLKDTGVAMVSGMRAYDMALRLQYDEIIIDHVTPSLNDALRDFIAKHPDTPKRIYCTYTAMLALRRDLRKITDVETIS